MRRTGSSVIAGIVLGAWLFGCAAPRGTGREAATAPVVTPPVTPTPVPAPAERAVDPLRFAEADRLIDEAIARGDIPGAVLLVGRGDEVVYRRAYGHRAVQPERLPMTVDTIFDMASVTKPVATATAVMMLVDRGRIRVDEPAAKYLPDFATNGKQDITIEQLLVHRGGLIPDNAMSDYAGDRASSVANVYALSPRWPPGSRFAYSDVGYIVLGELVHAVDGRPLDVFAKQEIFEPLGMVDSSFNPPSAWRDRYAPTEQREGRWMIGEVHDPRAYRMGGVAGHAGLFGTADDLARYCRMMLRRGELDGKRIMSEATWKQMIEPRWWPNRAGARSYGFDVDTAYSSSRGLVMQRGTSFGHTGFTGTMFWIDPANHCYVILLTNRVHPDGKGKVVALRKAVVTAASEAVLSPGGVLCGIDVLQRAAFRDLAGQRLGLITNHTGRSREGDRTIDLLKSAEGVNLVKIFSAEHGLFGKLEGNVDHSVDEPTGLKVYSLYGDTRRPTAEMLADIDTIVYDIQDIGARFYTYISTLGYAMEAAKEHGKRVVVLDRPNPITGVRVGGPLADADKLDFIAYRPIPLVHGMTVGELAMLFNSEYGIGCDLHVVKMRGWKRSMWYDATGLTWINPSPNMRNLTQATLYPAIGMLEATNLSVGRGTDQPFEVFGAPWIDPRREGHRRLAAALNEAGLPGLRFVPIEFTPNASKFADELCGGVYIVVTDRNAVEPPRTGLTIAWHLKRLFGTQFEADKVMRLLRSQRVQEAWQTTDDPATLPALWRDEVDRFMAVRGRYLIYE